MNLSIEFLSAEPAKRKTQPEICLDYRQVYRQQGDLRGYQIITIEGKIWVTQQGDLEDYPLGPGESFTITRPGRVVVQGMSPARFRFSGVK